MKPAGFDYARPDRLDEALAVLAEHTHTARVLAGGQSLGAMLNMRLVTPKVLIDISALAELGHIQADDGMIEVGAAVTQDQLLRWPGLKEQPLLAQTLPWVGHYQTRQRGTVCGSLAHGDPSSELPLVLAMLKGAVVLASQRGSRTLTAADFQTGTMQTAMRDDEMIVAARFPLAAPGCSSAFREIGPRRGDFAIVAAAAVGDQDGVSLGIGGVADTPAIRRLPWLDGAGLDDALNTIAWELRGSSDGHASAAYRRTQVRNLGRQVIGETQHALFNR
jgi:2-furoyl-CoA dehydrogenase FAD binding subunit